MSLPLIAFLIVFAAACAYAAGRLHQWYRTALERDEAWRDGYDQASGTLFKVATRVMRRKPGEHTTDIPLPRQPTTITTSEDATVTDITDAPSAGRHSFEIRHEVTRRLHPNPEEGEEKAV